MKLLYAIKFYIYTTNEFFFHIESKIHNDYLYITDLAPLWSGISPPGGQIDKLVDTYKPILFDHISGIPASSIRTDQQWDFPNVWAPYHDWIVKFLIESNRSDKALSIAQRFVQSVYCGWQKSTYIYEKYNADKVGEYGEGGEYVVQEGFGWTNGVAIIFMDLFGDKLNTNTNCNFSISQFRINYFNFGLIFIYLFYVFF